jgi:hypothetical protein
VLGSYVHGERTPLSQGALIRTEPIPYKNILNVAFVFCHSGFTKSLLYRAPPRCLLIYIQAFPSREAKCQEERLKGCREAEGCPEAEPEVFRSRHPRQYQSSHMQASRVRACWSPWFLVLTLQECLNVAFVFCHSGFTEILLLERLQGASTSYTILSVERSDKCQEEFLEGCHAKRGVLMPKAERVSRRPKYDQTMTKR